MGSTNNSAAALMESLGLPSGGIPEDIASGLDFDVESSLLSSHELLNDSGDAAKQMMTGEIPNDLRDQIEDISTSKSLSSGIGLGEAGRKLVARDFGITSMDIRERGISHAMGVSQAKAQISAMGEQVAEARRNYTLAVANTKATNAQIALAGAELVSRNQQFAMGLVNDLVLNNSRSPITGVQGNVDALLGNKNNDAEGFFEPTDRAILEIIRDYM